MNNFLLTRGRIKRVESLTQFQIAASQNGMFVSYRHSAFEERQDQDMKKSAEYILNQEFIC